MNHDPGMRQAGPLAGRTARQQEGPHACGLADAQGCHVGLDELHGVVDRHAGSHRATYQGQATDIEIHTREILKIRHTLNSLLAKHTGQDIETIARDTDRDNFMDPEQAKEYGLIDSILDKRVPNK